MLPDFIITRLIKLSVVEMRILKLLELLVNKRACLACLIDLLQKS